MLRRTTIGLGAAAVFLWIVTAVLVSAEEYGQPVVPIRAVAQSLAVTVTLSCVFVLGLSTAVAAVVARISTIESRRRAANLPERGAEHFARYILPESAQITMEIPKPRLRAPEPEDVPDGITAQAYKLGMKVGERRARER